MIHLRLLVRSGYWKYSSGLSDGYWDFEYSNPASACDLVRTILKVFSNPHTPVNTSSFFVRVEIIWRFLNQLTAGNSPR